MMEPIETMLGKSNAHNRQFFDEKNIPSDVWYVLRTASLLSVGEFRVFEIAYHQWFDKTGDEKTIERFFIPYMFKDVVPVWVEHFCKRVLELDREDALDPTAFGIVTAPATRAQQNKGFEYLIWAVGTLALLVWMAELAAQHLTLECMFPPCY